MNFLKHFPAGDFDMTRIRPFSRLVMLALAIGLVAPGLAANTSGIDVPPLPEFDTANPVVYGQQLAVHADTFDQGWVDEVSRGTMTLFDADGDSVRRSFTRMSLEQEQDGDRFLIKFLSPAEIKGVAALTHENSGSSDDNWLYLPANKRVRRVSGANNTASFQGTEFTFEDLSDLDPLEYDWRFIEETTIDQDGEQLPVYKLDARPTYKDTGYSHLVLYVHRTEWRQERIEYYDKAGKHLKTRSASGWHLFHGRFWRSQLIDVTNHQTGKRTTLDQTKVFLNLSLYTSAKTGEARKNLTAAQFTTRAIQ
jgi:hypothetical protein